jgi:hypothetical protein
MDPFVTAGVGYADVKVSFCPVVVSLPVEQDLKGISLLIIVPITMWWPFCAALRCYDSVVCKQLEFCGQIAHPLSCVLDEFIEHLWKLCFLTARSLGGHGEADRGRRGTLELGLKV